MAPLTNHFDFAKLPKCKIELHVHLDGSVRTKTMWEVAKQKGIHLAGSYEEFKEFCHIKKPASLPAYLEPIYLYLPAIVGDTDTLERIAYEFCEDAANENLCYVEVRYSPHLFSSTHGSPPLPSTRTVTPSDVVESVNKGLLKGSTVFGIKVRSILCGVRGRVGWMEDVVKLCNEYRHQNVVGIDVSGSSTAEIDTTGEIVEAYKMASSLGIHRTFHAGEEGPAAEVRFGVKDLMSERIGHGYHLTDDQQMYEECIRTGVHFETCPHSSFLTGAVKKNSSKHPIVRLAEDNANFSVNRDDFTMIQKTLDENYDLLRELGLKEAHLVTANINAARSSFLPSDEKKELLNHLKVVYGLTRGG